jgi:hypothetical protein
MNEGLAEWIVTAPAGEKTAAPRACGRRHHAFDQQEQSATV